MFRQAINGLITAIIIAVIFDEISRVVSRHADQMRREISDGLFAAGYAFLPERDKIDFAASVVDLTAIKSPIPKAKADDDGSV